MALSSIGQNPNIPAVPRGELNTQNVGVQRTAIGQYANMSADAADVLLSLAAAVHTLAAATANGRAADEQVGFELDASTIPPGGFAMHLPSGADLCAYSIENNSLADLTIFAGQSPSGRQLNSVAAGYYKSASVPMGITSLCLATTGPGAGLVRIIITTRFMAIGQGLCKIVSGGVGAAAAGDTYIAYPGGSAGALVVKSAPGTLAQIVNTNTNAQTATLTFYDSATTASGSVLYACVLGAGQIITLNLAAQFGIVAQASATTVAGNPINIGYI